MRSLLLIVALALPLFSQAASEADQRATEQQIDALKREISQVEARIGARNREQRELQQALKESEQQIGQVIASLRALNEELAGLDQDLSGLRAREAQLEQSLAASAERVQAQLRAQYQQGRQPQLQLMLGDQDPARVERLLYYYDHLNARLVEQLREYRTQLAALDSTRHQAASTNAAMVQKRAELEAQKQALDAARERRANSLAKLQAAQREDRQRLSSLQANQQQLETLLEQIRESLRRARLETANQAFDTLKGELPWPVDGRLARRFGDKVNDLAYEGVLIGAPPGREVRAVHGGRVVFADWLRGYGLLLIIDHGGGYMSLYGHNQSLLRDTGTWVRPGEVIATTGDGGGYDAAGLYFAIRHRGSSIDPGQWLAGR